MYKESYRQGDLSRQILDNYRGSTAVKQDYLQYLSEKLTQLTSADDFRKTESRERLIEKSTASIIDRVYSVLEAYALELNRTRVPRDLLLTCQPPVSTTELSEYDHLRRPSRSVTYYRSRFSTRHLSLVVRGASGRIDFYLISTDRVIGLSRVEEDYSPLMTFAVQEGESEFDWVVEGRKLDEERLERYCLLTLEHLLDQSSLELGR